ncbi:MAG TPA: hypothetical protein VEP90_03825 [Methylomirabilota bacterium]|nr:hypothetical protein [Methylomirabilota bacterium]
MRKIIHTQVKMEGNEIRMIVTAHVATLYRSIEATATRRLKSDRSILSYWAEKGKPHITKHGIVQSEETNIEGYKNFHCLFTL